VLVAFGGAAALHACGLAAELAVSEILVPADAGLLSAWGVIAGPVVRDRSRTLRIANPGYDELGGAAETLEHEARAEVGGEGIPASRMHADAFVRMRYLGQSLELEVPLARDFRVRFDREHERLLHTSSCERDVEACGLRVTVTGLVERPRRSRSRDRTGAGGGKPVARSHEHVYLAGRSHRVPIYERGALGIGQRLRGPAVVTEYSATVLVQAGWVLHVDERLNLRMERSRG
jgi:N-methylhydantoinase A/oxoprolinase/acetone carboxylase beta subunit